MTQITSTSVTVQDYMDQLQAERNAQWTQDRLTSHSALRQSLEDNAGRDRFVKVGDTVAPFVLDEADGGQVVLDELLADGPVVLLFFRFEGCPACNAAMRGYHETLEGPLKELGAHLVAISPQAADRLAAIKRRQGLDFSMACDPGAALIDSFGIGFAPDDAGKAESMANGTGWGDILGTGSWTLPYPTAVVIGRDRVVRFVDIHPNWMVRTQATTILDAVGNLDTW